jgi:hypothetical protein
VTRIARRQVAARAACDEIVTPAVALEVTATWCPLLAGGVHASAAALVSQIFGPGGARLIDVEAASGAVVWSGRDRCGRAAAVDSC